MKGGEGGGGGLNSGVGEDFILCPFERFYSVCELRRP